MIVTVIGNMWNIWYVWSILIKFYSKKLSKDMFSRLKGIKSVSLPPYVVVIISLFISYWIGVAVFIVPTWHSNEYKYAGPITERISSTITRVGEDTVFFTPDTTSYPGQSYRVFMSLDGYSATSGDFDFLRPGDKVIIAKNTKGAILCIEDVPSNMIFTAPDSQCNW